MMIAATMPGQDAIMNPFQHTQLRALVVDPDEQSRVEVVSLLTRQGMDVVGCANVEHGRLLFTDQAMVIAPINGNNRDVVDFVQWLRTRSGPIQPYVLGVGDYQAPASEWHGFNEFMEGPIDGIKALLSIEAARRWHGWTVQASPNAEPKGSSPSAVVNTPTTYSMSDEVSPSEMIPEGEDVSSETSSTGSTDPVLDWNALIADITCQPVTNPIASSISKSELGEAREVEPDSAAEAPPTLSRLPESFEPALSLRPTHGMTGALFQQITENSPFGLLLLDDASNVIYANPQHRTILGVSVEEAGGLVKWLEQGCAAEPQQRTHTLDTWWEHVWRRRVPIVLTMRSAEHLLKEIEFRPSILPDDRLIVAIFDVTDAKREEESVRTSESRFRSLFLQQPFGVVVVNAGGNIIDASSQFEAMAGCSRLDMRRMGLDKFFSEGDFVTIRQQTFSSRKGEETKPLTVELLPRNGAPVALSCQVSAIRNFSGSAVFIAYYFQPLPSAVNVPVLHDQPPGSTVPTPAATPGLALEIDHQDTIHPTPTPPPPPAIPSLDESSDVGQSTGILVSGMHLLRQAVILTNERGRITNVNRAAEGLFGYTREELMNSGLYRLFLPNQPKEFAQKISDHLNRHRCWIGNSTFHRKDGSQGCAAVELVPYEQEGKRGFLGLMREVEESPTTLESASAAGLGDSNALAHDAGPVVTLHRARNDLQVISSLLSMQASSEGDTVTAREALHDGKDRVGAVALVYRLVDSASGQVNLSQYASELSGVLLRSNGVEDGRIGISVPSGPAMVNQKLAISLGLLLQELLTSVIKFSFPNQCRGSVAIDINLSGAEGSLSVKDNGPFQSQELLAKRSQTFGWKVVEALTQQLKGGLKVLSDLDNEILIRFPISGTEWSGD